MRSIKTLAREAYKNRYAFDSVSIDRQGDMKGHFLTKLGAKLTPGTSLGNIADCCTRENERKTGIRFYNRDFLVFTFAMK